jgi:broad specificity phosphatase PhoE
VTTSYSPGDLVLVRHAESAGNVARERAEGLQAETIDIDQRDPDVGLSELGERQAKALGERLTEVTSTLPIGTVWVSPYVRTRRTAEIATETAGIAAPHRVDERLRDRELGILDRLTSRGIRARHPDEAARRRYLGKFYYRPPGGESWADIALRLRSFLADRERSARDGAELVVTHDAVILLLRYVLLGMSEAELHDVAADGTVGNASITWLHRGPEAAGWEVREYGTDEHLDRLGVEPTRHARDTGGLHAGTAAATE